MSQYGGSAAALYGVLGQVWYLIVSIPDLFHLSYLISLPISTLYTIIMPFYAFEISYILKVFKTLLKLFLNFFLMLSINRQ